LRTEQDRPIVAIGGAVKEGDVKGHGIGNGKVRSFPPLTASSGPNIRQ
jgi:hypothetical protein